MLVRLEPSSLASKPRTVPPDHLEFTVNARVIASRIAIKTLRLDKALWAMGLNACSNPELHALQQPWRQLAINQTPDFLGLVTRAKVRKDDQLVVEPIGSLHDIVQVHVSEFVDFFATMIGPDEADLRDEDLG